MDKYVAEGKCQEGEDLVAHFDMSWHSAGGLNSLADLAFKDHSIPPEVEYDTLHYFFNQGSRMAERVWG